MFFYIVGITETCTRLAICPSLEDAEKYVGTLPHHRDGRYYIDGPVRETVVL